ncbi:MAG: hypothetical protein QXD51_01745 [Candidatus Anstonellales archaeon]
MDKKVELKHNPTALWFKQNANGFAKKEVVEETLNKTKKEKEIVVVMPSGLTEAQRELFLYAAALHGEKVIEENWPPHRG